MKNYLFYYLVIFPCLLFSNSSTQTIIPSEMLLSSDNSIIRTQVDGEQNEEDEEIKEELSDVSPESSIEDCNP